MNSQSSLRVLVVDDSALYRKIVRDVLSGIPGVEVIGAAANGAIALSLIDTKKPDVITLDFEMPQLDGIGVLKKLANRPNAPLAIMVSAFTNSGAEATTLALQEGAFDFILKPSTKSLDQSVAQLKRDIAPKLQACRARTASRTAKRVGSGPQTRTANRAKAAPPRPAKPTSRRGSAAVAQRRDIVAIAVSTGGPQALTRLLPKIPANFPCPIVMVQHMPPMFTASLAADLNKRCSLEVVEGSAGMKVQRGRIIIAPGGKQMRVVEKGAGPVIEITNDPPERNCKPAADYLFRSVASHYGAKTLGVVLTGMGDDGTGGAEAIKQQGGTILAQDEASCVVYGMPKAVADAGLVDHVAPLDAMASKMLTAAEGKVLV